MFTRPTEEMSLDQFVAYMKEKIDKFQTTWNKERAVDPKGWPAKLPLPDWLEQYEFLR